MKQSSMKVRTLTRIAMLAALVAICSQIAIPLPSGVPITLQTFAIALVGYLLGAKNSTFSVGTYLLIGVLGAPVFSNFMSGPAALFGKTGGFLLGFLPMAVLCGLTLTKTKPVFRLLLPILGLAVCHLCGVLQFAFLTGRTPLESALIVSVPYLIKDCLSLLFAERFAAMLRKTPVFASEIIA